MDNNCLANALAVAAVAGVHTYDLALVDEQRHADLGTGLQSSRFEGVGSGVAFQTRLGIGDSQLYLGRQLSKEDRFRRSVRNNLAGHSLFQEIHTGNEVVSDRHLLEALVVHEDVVGTLFVKELIRAALYANILQLLSDIEAALQYAAIYYIFEFNTHNRVSFTRFYVQELDYEIQTAVHADTYAVFDVLTVDHMNKKLKILNQK